MNGDLRKLLFALAIAFAGMGVGFGSAASQSGPPCPPEPSTCRVSVGNCDVSDATGSDCTEIEEEPGCESFGCQPGQT